MFRAKIIKAIALGLCMSVLYTGAAYAQSTAGSSPAFEGSVSTNNPLFEKQSEIDKILFTDKNKDIEAKGIKVVYTGVIGDNVEIGVASLTNEQADYLYGILGKDQVKIVSAEEAQIYTTMAAEPAVAPDEVLIDRGDTPVSDKGELYKDMPVTTTAADGAEIAVDGRVYKGSDTVATDDAATELENPDVIFYITAGGVAEPGQEAELVYATGESADVVKTVVTEDKEGISTPVIILLIAGGALVIGGGAVVLGKKRQ